MQVDHDLDPRIFREKLLERRTGPRVGVIPVSHIILPLVVNDIHTILFCQNLCQIIPDSNYRRRRVSRHRIRISLLRVGVINKDLRGGSVMRETDVFSEQGIRVQLASIDRRRIVDLIKILSQIIEIIQFFPRIGHGFSGRGDRQRGAGSLRRRTPLRLTSLSVVSGHGLSLAV